MFRPLIAGLAVLSLACVGTADAATKKKTRHHAGPAPVAAPPVYGNYAGTRGPAWANPNECFTDEGYGRYWPCGAGRSN
jgi:hypothetical protein